MNKRASRFIAVLCLTLGLLSNTSVAHEKMSDHDRTIGISYSPFQALFGAHRLGLESKANNILSLIAMVGVINTRWSIKPEFNNQPGTFFELTGGARFYVTGKPLDYGLYVEDTVFAAFGRTPDGVAITQPFVAGPNMWILGNTFQLGYEYVTDCGIYFDAYASLTGYLGWNFPNSSPGLVDAATYNLNMWRPSIGGRIGYAW